MSFYLGQRREESKSQKGTRRWARQSSRQMNKIIRFSYLWHLKEFSPLCLLSAHPPAIVVISRDPFDRDTKYTTNRAEWEWMKSSSFEQIAYLFSLWLRVEAWWWCFSVRIAEILPWMRVQQRKVTHSYAEFSTRFHSLLMRPRGSPLLLVGWNFINEITQSDKVDIH